MPVNVPLAFCVNVPGWMAIALPIPPIVLPVESVKFAGMKPNATKPYEQKCHTTTITEQTG